MKTIEVIEKELQDLLQSDKKSWVQIYRLMDQVDSNRLYEGSYRSYTAWVNHLSEVCQVHVSVLWKRQKAGKYYAAYQKRSEEAGKRIRKLEDISISPDNLELIEKIAGNNIDIADDLIDQVIKGELGRSQLKNAWTAVKADRLSKGEYPVRKTRHDKERIGRVIDGDVESDESSMVDMTDMVNTADLQNKFVAQSNVPAITAMDIILALEKDSHWFCNQEFHKERDASQTNPYITEKYQVFPEFAVRTGSTRHARRVDALILENITAGQDDAVTIHGIEIKISKSDLLQDTKMAEYRDFVDVFWLAVPESLQTEAESVLAAGWGLVVVGSKYLQTDSRLSLRIIHPAVKKPGIMRDATMAGALCKLLKSADR